MGVTQLQTFPGDVGVRGFAFTDAATMRTLLTDAGLRQWETFAASWDDLGPDTYMADGGRYRKRRYAVFAISPDAIVRAPHQPHYQSRDYNQLNGGVQRWFAPITAAVAEGDALQAVLRLCRDIFGTLTPDAALAWHAEVHQFRIEARAGEQGRPTPEGMHRDGVDWVLVLLIARRNVASGETHIADLAGVPLGSFTLTTPMDAAWVDDSRVRHGVTPIEPLDPALPSYRDVLVVTFRKQAAGAPSS
jgi:hypothetical protein